jgi:hypothetical protein
MCGPGDRRKRSSEASNPLQPPCAAELVQTGAGILVPQAASLAEPPPVHFGWSNENPLAASASFFLFGEGNVPWMVRELIRKQEPNPDRDRIEKIMDMTGRRRSAPEPMNYGRGDIILADLPLRIASAQPTDWDYPVAQILLKSGTPFLSPKEGRATCRLLDWMPKFVAPAGRRSPAPRNTHS